MVRKRHIYIYMSIFTICWEINPNLVIKNYPNTSYLHVSKSRLSLICRSTSLFSCWSIGTARLVITSLKLAMATRLCNREMTVQNHGQLFRPLSKWPHFTMKYIEGHQSLANINENNTYSQSAGPAGYSNTSSQHTLREILVYCLKNSLRFNIGP